MSTKRLLRLLAGILVLAALAFFNYAKAIVSPHTDDIGKPGGLYDPYAHVYPAPPFDKLLGIETPDYLMHITSQAPEGYEGPAEADESDASGTADASETQSAPEQSEASEGEPAPMAEPTIDPNSPLAKAMTRAAELNLPAPPDIDVDSWELILVNGDHPLDPIDYEPAELVYLNMTGDDTDIRTSYDGNRQVVDGRIAQALIDMTQACKAAGNPIFLSSGYRSYSTQQANFQRINANNGISDGKDANGHYITMPAGCSEHQTGLCCDITDRYYEIKRDDIVNSATVQWLAANCADYGFILRFPAEKGDITKVMSENWHFRYVGKDAARYMMDNDLCLEEFLALYGVV